MAWSALHEQEDDRLGARRKMRRLRDERIDGGRRLNCRRGRRQARARKQIHRVLKPR